MFQRWPQRTTLIVLISALIALPNVVGGAPSIALERHERDVAAILAATTDSSRDQAFETAKRYLDSSSSRIGSWTNPYDFARERYADLLNAYAYSEFSNRAARIRAGEQTAMKESELRLRTICDRVFRENGSRLLPAWEQAEVVQNRVSTVDIYRVMVDRLAEENKKFPRLKILQDKIQALGGIHILQQKSESSIVATEILVKLKSAPSFPDSTRAEAKRVLSETRSAGTRIFGECSVAFRKLGGG